MFILWSGEKKIQFWVNYPINITILKY